MAPGAILRNIIETGNVPSFILWGPPGVGKTSIASVIAEQSNTKYYALSAVNSGVKDVRQTIESAKKQKFFDSNPPILFIDEIHRFSKSQQDSLLMAVEKGIVTLIGATTENPSFEVISALLSRCQVYILKALEKADLTRLVDKALKEDVFFKEKNIKVDSYDALLRFSGGDARKLYNSLEILINQIGDVDEVIITDELVEKNIQQNIQQYDKTGENHYDTVSAFIKSVRGSDPNAAVYYLARMIAGGEDPKFICRRMIILAAEDIGLANPNALLIATNCFSALEKIGMPEGRIIMSQVAIYLAASPKSNSAYEAIARAQESVQKTGGLSIPLKIRNAPTELMKELNYGKDYQYAHNYEQNFVMDEYLPEEIAGSMFYKPSENGSEKTLAQRLRTLWKEKYKF
jgi:putative ATPase